LIEGKDMAKGNGAKVEAKATDKPVSEQVKDLLVFAKSLKF